MGMLLLLLLLLSRHRRFRRASQKHSSSPIDGGVIKPVSIRRGRRGRHDNNNNDNKDAEEALTLFKKETALSFLADTPSQTSLLPFYPSHAVQTQDTFDDGRALVQLRLPSRLSRLTEPIHSQNDNDLYGPSFSFITLPHSVLNMCFYI